MDSDSSGEDFMPGDSADRRRAKLFKKKHAATKSLPKQPATCLQDATAPDIKKKRGRPKGSKNKMKETKTSPNLPAVLAPGTYSTMASTNLSVPKKDMGRNKIVLKINVSKGIVSKGNNSSSSSTEEKLQDSPKLMKWPLTESNQSGIHENNPSTSALPTGKVAHYPLKSSDESSSARKRRKVRPKLLKPDKPSASSLLGTSMKCGPNTVTCSPRSKAAKLQKRYVRVPKLKKKKHKKQRSDYFTLIPNKPEDNSARSSGSTSSSEDDSAWDRRLSTRDANAVTKQADLPESSPEKRQRRRSLSPCSSPDRFPDLDLNCSSATDPAVQLLWPQINLDGLKSTNPKTAHNTIQLLDIKSQVQVFFSKPGDEMPAKSSQVRYPVVHEANCCMQWQARSAERGKQPAGKGSRKRKGVHRGYLTCPCQNGAGPSSASFGPSSARAVEFTPPNSTASTGCDVSTSTSASRVCTPVDIADNIYSRFKHYKHYKPYKGMLASLQGKKSSIMDISDISSDEDLEEPLPERQGTPSPEKLVVAGKLPFPCSRRSSNDSDVEFVPGPPIEEIVVSDDSNDIIFVSETASPKSKALSAASKPKVAISCDIVEVISTESTDVIYDFERKTTSSSMQKFDFLPTVDTPLSDVKPEVEPCIPQQPNPICALPPPENTVTSFDTPYESLYPKQSTFTEPLDFDALLNFAAEAMATENYGEPYAPCVPNPPYEDYDRGDDIIDKASPERGVPVQEKEDGLVVWECPVCFEPKGDDTILATTDCTHLFCDPCIRKVAAIYGKCPVCQFDLKEVNIHPFRFHGYKF